MLKKISITVLVLLAGTSLIFAGEVTGRDMVADGAFASVSGMLVYESSEWYLKTDEKTYQLHLGNKEYLESTGIDLQEGAECSIEGFLLGQDIAVSSVTLDGKTYNFREKDGTPMWAGRGNHRNSES